MGCRISDDSVQEEYDDSILNRPMLKQDAQENPTMSRQSLYQMHDHVDIQEGYLYDGKGIKAWVVLTTRYLYCYNGEHDTASEVDKLDLYVFDSIRALKDSDSNRFTFVLSSPSTHKVFSAESAKDMLHWMDVIQRYQSIHVGFLKTPRSKKWRTCVLRRDSILVFKDAEMSLQPRRQNTLNLFRYDDVVVHNVNDDNPVHLALISRENKSEAHIICTCKTTTEMKEWIRHIGKVHEALTCEIHEATLNMMEFKFDCEDQEPPVPLETNVAVTKPVWLGNESDLSMDTKKCKTVYDCSAVKRIRSLMLLYNHQNTNDIQYLSLMEIMADRCKFKYDTIRILNDYIHIIKTHDVYLEDLCFNTCDIEQCNAFKRNQSNRLKQYMDDNDSKVSDETIVMIDILDQIHCYLFHTFDTGHRLTKQEQLIVESAVNKDHILVTFNTIRRILSDKKNTSKFNKFVTMSESKSRNDELAFQRNSELSVLAKYYTLKDELTSHSNICCVSMNQWNHVYKKAMHFQRTNYAKKLQIKEDDDMYSYGIRKYSHLPINNLVVVVFYTDFDELRSTIKRTLTQQIQEHSDYYWFNKTLGDTLKLYGKDYEGSYKNPDHTLYHNISSAVRFGSTTITFPRPVSTTTQLVVAQRYGIDTGYMLQFDAYSKEICLHYLATAWISSFANQNETILDGGLVPLKLINCVCYANGREYRVLLHALHQISQCLNGYGPHAVTENDTDILNLLLFGPYVANGIPKYFVDIFETFVRNTRKVNIVIEHISEFEYYSSLLLCCDEDHQPFVHLDNLQRKFSNVEHIEIYPGYKKHIVVSLGYCGMISSILIKCSGKMRRLKSIKLCNVKFEDGAQELVHSIKDKFEALTGFGLELQDNVVQIHAKSTKALPSLLKQQESQISVIY
eukprot:110157_1